MAHRDKSQSPEFTVGIDAKRTFVDKRSRPNLQRMTQSGRRLASRAITTNALLDRDFSPPEVRTKGRPTAARGRLHAQAVAAAQCPGRGPTALASTRGG